MTAIIVTIVLNIVSSMALLLVPLIFCGGKKEGEEGKSKSVSSEAAGKKAAPSQRGKLPNLPPPPGAAPEAAKDAAAKSKSAAPEPKGEEPKKEEEAKEEKKEEEKGGEKAKKEEEKKEEGAAPSPGAKTKPALSVKNQPYPSIKEPTKSNKKKKEAEAEKDKKDKIADGFYQSKSDEDDTLEKVASLKEEQSGKSKKNGPSGKSKKNKK